MHADCWIDFSNTSASIELARVCAEKTKPLLVATTGFSDKDIAQLKVYAQSCPILLCPNTSLGVFVLKELSVMAKSLLGESYDIEILELHHNKKKDAPSGTALHVANAISGGEPLMFDRSNLNEPRTKGEIGVVSIRGGDIPGEHTVYFCGPGERIEISHKVWDRRVFARGALQLAAKLIDKNAGFYTLTSQFFT